MENFYEFIDKYNINNNQNHRYLIIGNSGSGKTSLAISLILSELPRHKKIYFIVGGDNILLHKLKKDFEDNNVKIEIHIINDLNDIEKLNISPKMNELVVLDDLSHLIKNSKKLMIFVNKIFTASRQSKYNVILILHKLKMFNGMVRQNATKIFITSLSKEIIDEFDLEETPQVPFVIDNNKGTIGGHIINKLNFDNVKFDKNLPIITKEKNNNIETQFKLKSPSSQMKEPALKSKISSGIKNAITEKPLTNSSLKKRITPQTCRLQY